MRNSHNSIDYKYLTDKIVENIVFKNCIELDINEPSIINIYILCRFDYLKSMQ